MHDADLLRNYLILGGLLAGIGVVGFLARRNMIVMFLSAEMILQGVALNLVAFSRYWGTWNGQIFALFSLTVAASEAALALALILTLFRRRSSLDISLWQDLREPDQPPTLDQELPEPLPEETPPEWPHLPPAGVAPPQPTPPRPQPLDPLGQRGPTHA